MNFFKTDQAFVPEEPESPLETMETGEPPSPFSLETPTSSNQVRT